MAAPGAANLIKAMVSREPLPAYAKAFSFARYSDDEYMKNIHKIVSGKL